MKLSPKYRSPGIKRQTTDVRDGGFDEGSKGVFFPSEYCISWLFLDLILCACIKMETEGNEP